MQSRTFSGFNLTTVRTVKVRLSQNSIKESSVKLLDLLTCSKFSRSVACGSFEFVTIDVCIGHGSIDRENFCIDAQIDLLRSQHLQHAQVISEPDIRSFPFINIANFRLLVHRELKVMFRERQEWSSDFSRETFETMICIGVGLYNIMIAMTPPRILK